MRKRNDKKGSANQPIKIRYRKLKDGRKSVFLDSCMYDFATGEPNKTDKHSYRFLGLYIVPEKTPLDKASNKQTMMLVHDIVAQTNNTFSQNRLGVVQRHSSKDNFIDYLNQLMQKKEAKRVSNKKRTSEWYKLRLRLTEFASDYIPFSDIDKEFIADFIDYLKGVDARCHYALKKPKKLCAKTISTYYDYLRSAINSACRDGLMVNNPTLQFSLASKIKVPESDRAYLEIPEIKALMKLETKYDMEKRAFIFACLCGLRSSDIRALTWEKFPKGETNVNICVRMEKTQELLYMPISPNALMWLPERGDAKDTDFVFPLIGEGKVNAKLKKMMDALGIDKHITFHCSRHTFATMMLTLGASIYTVSKLLGHASVEQTMVYAHLIDKKKEQAISLIPSLSHNNNNKAS